MTISQAIAPAVRSEKELFALLEVASTEVFRMMAGSELERTNDARWKGAELTAMVGLAGDLCGLLSVPCSQDSARQVAALMLGLAPEKAADCWARRAMRNFARWRAMTHRRGAPQTGG